MTISTIDPASVQSRRTSGTACVLIDVRSPGEFSSVHADGAMLMPLDRLDPAQVTALRQQIGADAPIYLLCHSGGRASIAAKKLSEAGLAGCHVVSGGTQAWVAAGLPVVRGKGSISIERQVRIGAGFLVASGVALGWYVHAGFYGVPAFVGVGLMFAGITDLCMMGLLLARMPWNQAGGSCQKA